MVQLPEQEESPKKKRRSTAGFIPDRWKHVDVPDDVELPCPACQEMTRVQRCRSVRAFSPARLPCENCGSVTFFSEESLPFVKQRATESPKKAEVPAVSVVTETAASTAPLPRTVEPVVSNAVSATEEPKRGKVRWG